MEDLYIKAALLCNLLLSANSVSHTLKGAYYSTNRPIQENHCVILFDN